MIDLRVQTDLSRLERTLTELEKRQLPFALARGLTRTARVAAQTVTRELPNIFDRPTPFTRNAIGFEGAKRDSLVARVFVKDRQAEYLKRQEEGGTETPKGRAFVMPRAVRRNQYGNIPRNAIQALKRRKDIYIGPSPTTGQGGIWRRRKDDSLQPLILFTSQATYKPVFGFKDRVGKAVRENIRPELQASIAAALATARR